MTPSDIASHWPFDALPEAAGQTLSDAALRFELAPEAWLFQQGDMADALFVLVEGELDVYQGDPPRWRKRIEAGSCIGELPLVIGGNRRRTATLRAVGPCKLLVLRYADIRRLLSRKVFDGLLKPVSERHLERLELGLSNMLGRLPLELLVEVDATMIPRRLSVGEVLFEQGDPLEHVWLVDEGRLEVLVHAGEGAELRRVAEIGRGQPVGELAMLVGGERSATVRAMRDTWLRGLSAATFEALLLGHPGAALGLAKTLAKRLVHANEKPVELAAPHMLALLPADAEVDLQAFAENLVGQLAGPTTIAGRESFAKFGALEQLDGVPGRRRFGEWLSTLEAEHDAIVLLLGHEPDAWTRACIEAADELVLVATLDGETQLNAVELELDPETRESALLSLVLCRPPGSGPSPDAVFEPWLSLRPDLLYLHQIAEADPRDFARLGRGLFRN